MSPRPVLARVVPWAAAAVILVLFLDWLGGPTGPAGVFRDSIDGRESPRERESPGAPQRDGLADAAERAVELLPTILAIVGLVLLAFLVVSAAQAARRSRARRRAPARAARRSPWEWPAPPWVKSRPSPPPAGPKAERANGPPPPGRRRFPGTARPSERVSEPGSVIDAHGRPVRFHNAEAQRQPDPAEPGEAPPSGS